MLLKDMTSERMVPNLGAVPGVSAVVVICTFLTACGAIALPFRVTADVARVVPVAGDVVAAPLDATGDAID
jgi:hypothetical protein